ncbi:unnamed protein product [Nippostrongylus brasiliensis]|uniref:RusA family crossover junction endodeoxyribonuclease n=1 Tax=Nippostrongylus brasiliensis TaxID=27835 RepID=A0A0N4Y5U4_NIPBR|nr:unnamed protein product [Nippostrongylus brasiliensis]
MALMTESDIYQDQVNRKVLLEWVRITGLTVPPRANFDLVLKDFAVNILEYPSDAPQPFSWPVQAGFTSTGPAIRAKMSYTFWRHFMKSGRRKLYDYNRKHNTEIKIIREKTKPVMDQEKLGLYIRKKIREAYQKANKKGVEVTIIKGKIVMGKEEPMRPTVAAVRLGLSMDDWQGEPLESMFSKHEKEELANDMNCINNKEDVGPSQPKRKRTLTDYIQAKESV